MKTLGIVAGIVGTGITLVVGVGVLLLAARPAPAESLPVAQPERHAINLPGRTTQAPFSDATRCGRVDPMFAAHRDDPV